MIGAQQILNKIRQICESCYEGAEDQIKIPRNYKNLSQPNSQQSHKQIPQVIIKQYLTTLDYLQQYIHEIKQCKSQYQHLEESLQKQQLQIRKHIGIQQQLRLYSQSIKLQLQECEKDKLQLLENSKHTIKAIKLKNQKLFQQITSLKNKLHQHQIHNQKPHQVLLQKQHKPSSHTKTKIKDKSLSQSAEHKDSSLHKIIKTQYIERQKHPFLNLNIRKQLKYKNQLQNDKKPHKHYKSTHIKAEDPQNSQSKKKHKAQYEKGKKDKIKSTIQSKQFDLGTYLSKNQLKKSPNKNIEKHSAKQHSSKPNEKHNKSSFQERSEKQSKPETEQKMRRDEVKLDQGQSSKQKQRSKQKNKRKSREKAKQKAKESKKTVQHNRSLFSVSSVEYRSRARYNC